MFDWETRGLVKQALDQKRAVEEGRMDIKDATALPEGTFLKNGRVKLPPTGLGPTLALGTGGLLSFGAIALLGLAIALAFSVLRAALTFEYLGVPLYLALAVAAFCLILGVVLHWARDIRQWTSVKILQIGLGVAGAVIGFLTSPDAITKTVVLAAAGVTIADGFDKLRRT